ncbi:1-phosphofructokinase [Litorihabitans aurantiacus]|uniref:1-phosphofructokinase n=1 Tax=Litorihabitans aurantiacus TaxID=1930061 RepID=A0AA37XAP4_9MICO|nr:1-phosphofructokinase [Litorihabitans aurantiacus]GMA30209.1 1-phosphofructokinase [Litorihabitans aurantiacus]
MNAATRPTTIVTVTLNPSVDRTIEIARLERGRVSRATGNAIHPGGKGVNVTRALLANGFDSLALLPLGGPDGRRLAELLEEEGVAHDAVAVHGETRSNITVAEPDGTTTKLNAQGEALRQDELDAVVARLLQVAHPGDWVVLCGSLPPGVPDDVYATVTGTLREAGMRVVVDTSGPALTAALAAAPDLVKPNAEELAQAVGRPVVTVGDAVAAAQEVRERGVETVVISLGAAGAVLVDGEGVLAGTSRAAEVRSSVGAGDCFLAGYLGARDAGRDRALTTALAYGAAAVQLPGSQVPGPDDVDLAAARILTSEELEASFATLVD